MLIPILLTRYGNQARIAINPAFRRNCAHIRRILQPRWQPILEELRLAFQSSQRTRNEDPKYTAQLRDICKVWQELGACYNLNSHSRERDSLQSLISYVTPAERLQGCFMTECPCYGRKSPWHKTRRVCRGCWAAYYCNKQCQKRDWDLGHKETRTVWTLGHAIYL
ncbi:hypothetical protein BC629DRAFT_505983 [Irpex lacteus]|nr:hypothetical protein BC629DRAFT_505983 [Irpex lacteus]